MRPKLDVPTKNKRDHGAFGRIAESLTYFWGVDERYSDAKKRVPGRQHLDRVPIEYSNYATTEALLLRAGSTSQQQRKQTAKDKTTYHNGSRTTGSAVALALLRAKVESLAISLPHDTCDRIRAIWFYCGG